MNASNEKPTFVIVGGGLGAAKGAEALRNKGFDGDVVLISQESQLPYERPPLSKEYLAGDAKRGDFTVHPQEWYAEQRITLRLGVAVDAIDRETHELTLSDGSSQRYDKLLLATGSRARNLPMTGAGAAGAIYLRNVEDSDRLRAAILDGKRMVVIGGGWIGMEAAAVARSKGAQVDIVEAAELPLVTVLGPEMARVFMELHEEHGVTFHLGASVDAITVSDAATPGVTGVRLGDGTTLPVDLLLIGIGAVPNTEIAEAAGLRVERGGVVVDEALVSSDPDVVAVGDIALHQHPVLHKRLRVEHWATALNQPPTAAGSMLGEHTAYVELPFFFTDQYDLGMEYRGNAAPGEAARVVTRGDVGAREFVAFWLDADDRMLAGMNVNVWDVGEAIENLIRSGKPMDVVKLADATVALDAVLA